MYGYGYGYGIDWAYIILVLPAVIFSLWASARVNSTFRRYQGQYARNGLTGAEAARAVLERNGVYDVRIERVGGSLTDHYDPSANVIRLSESVYGSCSTAAIGVACHEAGHAVQHAEHYFPASIRSAIVPVTNIGSRLSMPLIVLGIIFSSFSYFFVYVAYAGVLCFGLSTLFQLVTLPTEFDASRRAIWAIEDGNLLDEDEQKGAKKVLRAAAMTYVAALAVSVTQLFRLLLIVGGRRRDDRR